MHKTVTHLLLLTGVAALVLFVNLGDPPLWDRDEPRNAACAREMMERGDWVVPTFNGELRVLKPVMKYWLMIVAYKIFGVGEFAARFFSAVSVVGVAWVTYFLARCLFNARAALFSALVLLSSLLFVAAGHLAKIDATLTLFSSLGLLTYVAAAFRPGVDHGALLMPVPRWRVWALAYAFLGLAALAKGLPGLVPAAVLGMFLLIIRLPRSNDENKLGWRSIVGILRPFAPLHFLRTFWLMRPLTAVAMVLLTAGPWYLLVGLRTDGEFLRGFFLEHHLGRAMAPMEHHDGPFLLYYLATIAVGLFPWSVFLGPVAVWLAGALRSAGPRVRAYLFLACWVGVYVVLFSCAQTKLPSYITPCFPGLALLVGAYLDELCGGAFARGRLGVKAGLVTLGVCGTALVVGLGVASRFVPLDPLLGLMGLILAAGAVVAYVLVRQGRTEGAVNTLLATAATFTAVFFGVGLSRVGALQPQKFVCAELGRQNDGPLLASFGAVDPSWVFYAGQPIGPVCLNGEEAAPAVPWKVSPVNAGEFFRTQSDGFIITNDKDWEYLKPSLPSDARVVAEAPRFFRKGRWLVIGHGPVRVAGR